MRSVLEYIAICGLSHFCGSLLSGIAKLRPTLALAWASTYLALASKTDVSHVIIYL